MPFKAEEKKIGKKKQLRLMTFMLALFTATALFIPSIVISKGYFIFFGDFNVQQIPFYQYCHEAVRSGSFGWSWQTDLGSDLISSYSFYLLGSPFFWLTIPFPNSFVPYLMAPLLILKFSLAALFAYMYIRRFTARAETAMIGGLLYAFCGFSVYNIFFNHFHEAIVFFPLLLLCLEKFIAEKKRGLLILAVFLCSVTNYYFFFGMVVFTVIYWFVRICSHSFKFKASEFLLMLFECVLGLLLAAALLLPSVMAIVQNSRLSSTMNGWGAILYGKEQIFLNVIQCFFFPPDLPARPIFFPGAEVKWSSLGGWLPLFGMTGVITYLMSEKKGTWLRRIIIICAFMALVPILNSAFSMFNTAYYARWFYMPILMMCLATALSFEDLEVNWKSAWRWSFGITAALTLVIGLFPKTKEDKLSLGLYTDAATNPIKYVYQLIRHTINDSYKVDGDYQDLRFWVTSAIAILSLFAVKALIPSIKSRNVKIFKPIIAMVCVVSVVYSVFFLVSGQSHSYDIEEVMINNLIEGNVTLETEDDEFARIDVYDGVDNTGLYLGYPSINFFHSIVSPEIMEFYNYIGVPRSVGSRPELSYNALRSFLSVKYLLDPEISGSKDFETETGEPQISGFVYDSTQNGYKIYRNENYIPMGFTYDYYVTEEQIEDYTKQQKNNIMLKALLIDKKDLAVANRYLKNIQTDYYLRTYETGKLAINFDSATVAADSKSRASKSAYSFNCNSNGFTAKINMEKDNLVFFSVPAADGWTATVNGTKAEILKVNKGFMAVAAPAGDNTIVFRYETPGLAVGILVTAATAVVTIIYLSAVAIKRKKYPAKEAVYPEGEIIENHINKFENAVILAESEENDSLLDSIDLESTNAYQGFKGGFTLNDSALLNLNFETEEETDVINPPENEE